MFDKLIAQLEPYFTKKAPWQIPASGREWIVNYAWIISLVLAILLVPTMLGFLTLFGILGAVAGVVYAVSPLYWLSAIALVIQFIFLVASIAGLKNKSYSKGWKIVFYGQIFGFAYGLLYFSIGSLVSGVIGLAIGLYVLFQIKSYFK